tara:strand:- start:33 stop:206 length:174 start_codon:yes stop_codon:yes gene_type:complete
MSFPRTAFFIHCSDARSPIARAMADVGQKRHNGDWGNGNKDRKRKKVRGDTQIRRSA